MDTYRVEITVSKDKTLSIKNIPFSVGDKVEVLVRSRKYGSKKEHRYPLRGQIIFYKNPFKGVAENNWAVLK